VFGSMRIMDGSISEWTGSKGYDKNSSIERVWRFLEDRMCCGQR
jgi:hypothetical protein